MVKLEEEGAAAKKKGGEAGGGTGEKRKINKREGRQFVFFFNLSSAHTAEKKFLTIRKRTRTHAPPGDRRVNNKGAGKVELHPDRGRNRCPGRGGTRRRPARSAGRARGAGGRPEKGRGGRRLGACDSGVNSLGARNLGPAPWKSSVTSNFLGPFPRRTLPVGGQERPLPRSCRSSPRLLRGVQSGPAWAGGRDGRVPSHLKRNRPEPGAKGTNGASWGWTGTSPEPSAVHGQAPDVAGRILAVSGGTWRLSEGRKGPGEGSKGDPVSLEAVRSTKNKNKKPKKLSQTGISKAF